MIAQRFARRDTVVVLLFLATLACMLWKVLLPPFIGYANSYDFLRQSACVGLWQAIEGVDKTLGNYAFPGRQLLFDGDRRPELCMHSVDNVFPWLVTLFHEPGQLLGFWQVALAKLLALSLAAGAVLYGGGRLRLPLAVVFAVLFTDWAYLAYANTLYLEFSVVMAIFVALAGGCCLLARAQRPGRLLLGLLLVALAWLALSKQQYGPLAVVLGCLYGVVTWLRWRMRWISLALALTGATGMLVFTLLNPPGSELMRTIDQVNKTNTYLGAVLPAARDPQAALRQLGLPDECLTAIGTNWYVVEGSRPCPAVVDVSRSRLPLLFMTQPETLVKPMYRIALGIRPLYPDYLGVVEPHAGTPAERKLALARATSFTTWVAALPEPLYLALVGAGMLGSMLAALLLCLGIGRGMGEVQRAQLAFLLLGGAVVFYALFSSVFGDGYIEMAKHAVAFGVGLVFQCVAAAWWLWSSVQRRLKRTSGLALAGEDV